jgi:hypothetical protein
MKRAFIVAFLLCAVVLKIGAQEVPPNTAPSSTAKGGSSVGKLNSQQKADKAQNPDAPTPPVPSCVQCLNCCPVEQPHAKTKEEEAKAASLDRLYRRYMWATIIGVGGGFLGLILIFWQTKIAARSANAALRSADTAKSSVQIVINAERAWISVQPYNWSPKFYPQWEQGDPIPEGPLGKQPITHLFQTQVKNVGRTPATIEAMAIRYIRIPYHPSQLPPEPDYGEMDTTVHFLIPADELQATGTLTPFMGVLTKKQISNIEEGSEFLYAYGIVQYRDIANERRETRFGYVYSNPATWHVFDGKTISPIRFDEPRFQRGGPPAYNRHI